MIGPQQVEFHLASDVRSVAQDQQACQVPWANASLVRVPVQHVTVLSVNCQYRFYTKCKNGIDNCWNWCIF